MTGGGEPTLLLVDDEDLILSALERTLRREGYRLLTAHSAEEALRVLARESVDLVISDHMMPRTNGLQLLTEVGERFPTTGRLLVTGWPEAIEPEQIRRVGIHALIPKPWDDAVLKQRIREALAGSVR